MIFPANNGIAVSGIVEEVVAVVLRVERNAAADIVDADVVDADVFDAGVVDASVVDAGVVVVKCTISFK